MENNLNQWVIKIEFESISKNSKVEFLSINIKIMYI